VSRRKAYEQGSSPRTALGTILDRQGRRLVWVAGRLGVDASTVSRWCSGDRPIPARRLGELAAVLEVDIADLVEADANRTVPG